MRAVVLIGLMVALAGCGDKQPADPSEVAGNSSGTIHTMHDASLYAEPHFVEEVFVEAFSFLDTEQASAARTLDISHLLPAGPSFVTVDISPDDGAVAAALAPSNFGQLWTYEQGETRIEAAVGPGALAIDLQYGGPLYTNVARYADHAQGVDYRISVKVEAGPQRMPSGMAVEVELPSVGSHVLFTGVEGNVPDVLVWGPDDAFMGTIGGGTTAKTTLQENGTAGKYVFLPRGHGSFYNLQVGTTQEPESYTPKVRLLTQTIVPGQVQSVPDSFTPNEPFSWQVLAVQMPLQVGACLTSQQGQASGGQITVIAPDGTEYASPDANGGPDYSTCVFSDMGDPALSAGEYEFRVDSSMRVGGQAQDYMIHYAR